MHQIRGQDEIFALPSVTHNLKICFFSFNLGLLSRCQKISYKFFRKSSANGLIRTFHTKHSLKILLSITFVAAKLLQIFGIAKFFATNPLNIYIYKDFCTKFGSMSKVQQIFAQKNDIRKFVCHFFVKILSSV